MTAFAPAQGRSEELPRAGIDSRNSARLIHLGYVGTRNSDVQAGSHGQGQVRI